MTDNPIKQALDARDCRDQWYIGDGVYVGFDGQHVWVASERALGEVATIALEPEVLAALLRYAERYGMPK